MIEIVKESIINNDAGLHARPLSEFVKLAKSFKSNILIEYNGHIINGKSLMSLLIHGIKKDSTIKVKATGKDAKEAVTRLTELLLNYEDNDINACIEMCYD